MTREGTQETEHSPRTSLGQRFLLVVFGLGLFVVLALLVEGGLARLGLGEAERWEDPFVGFAPGQDLFVEATSPSGGRLYQTREEKLAFFNPQSFAVDKTPGRLRVFAVGGSTTAGRPYDARIAFPRFLELFLGGSDEDARGAEVINAGAISYASYRIALLMRELTRYAPDVFVVYTGHNEFLEERSYADLRRRGAAWLRLQAWLQRWRVFALARRAWLGDRGGAGPADGGADPQAGRLAAEVETRLEGWTGLDLYTRDPELERWTITHFELNLHRMVDIARDAGAAIVFVQPASNLKDFSPFKSQHGDTVEGANRARIANLVMAAREGLALGEGASATAALANLDIAAKLDPRYAETHFRRGQALFALGRYEAATEAFIRAKDLDVAPLRALEPLVEAVARVGREREAPVIELPALLEASSRERFGHAIPGKEDFLDHVHPDVEIHARIGAELADLFAAEGWVERGSVSEGRRRQVLESVLAGIDRRAYAERDHNLARVLGWAGKLDEAHEALSRALPVLGNDPEAWLDYGILEQKLGRPEAAAEALERAAAGGFTSPELAFNRGVALAGVGRGEEAVTAFEDALRQRPDYPEALHNLGVVELRLGRLEAAAARFGDVLAARPEAVESRHQLARVLRRQGQLDAAAIELRRCLDEVSPGSSLEKAVRIDLASIDARQGRLDLAARALGKVLETAPDDAEALYTLGVVEAQRGQAGAAFEAYRRAVESDPGHAEALNNLGILLAGNGNLEAARQALERAVEARPAWAEARFNLGVVLDQSGAPDAALASVSRALELEPRNARFHQAMGMLLVARGERARGQEYLERAAELARSGAP